MHYRIDSEPGELLLDGPPDPPPPALTVPRSYVFGVAASIGAARYWMQRRELTLPAARALLWVAHLAWCGGAAAVWLSGPAGDESLLTGAPSRPVPSLRLQSLAQEPAAVASDGGGWLESWQWVVGGAATGLVCLELLTTGKFGQKISLSRLLGSGALGVGFRVVTAGFFSAAALLCQRLLPVGAEQHERRRRLLRAAAVLQLAGLPFHVGGLRLLLTGALLR